MSIAMSGVQRAALACEERCRDAVARRAPMAEWRGAQERITALRERMRGRFVDRDEAIDGILASLVSRAGCVLLGPPGTAKSMLVRAIAEDCRLITEGDDANYFEYLLTAHTMPEEVFGPTDVAKLLAAEPVVERRTRGRLPAAEIAFLDEVFRGGSHILNALLTILNERRYHNGRAIERVPLIGFIGAANHPPHTEELKAFFDRFPVRVWVESVLKTGSGDDEIERRAAKLVQASSMSITGFRGGTRAELLPSPEDFRYLWSKVHIELGMPQPGNQRFAEYVGAFRQLQSIGGLSDRAFVQLWYFAGALDLLSGRPTHLSYAEGGRGHFDCFKFTAPTLEASRNVVFQVDCLSADAHATGN